MNKLAGTLASILLLLALLYYGKEFLMPITLAIVLWFIVNSINDLFSSWTFYKKILPPQVRLLLSYTLVVVIMLLIGGLVAQNINGIINSSDNYGVNLEGQLSRMLQSLGIRYKIDMGVLATELNIKELIMTSINSLGAITQRFMLVMLYVLFLLIEQHTIEKKIAALRFSEDRKARFRIITNSINTSVRTYLGFKTLASLATAIFSFAILYYAGVEYSLFWAFLIFLFNYIPTIGSIAATILPALVALVQYDTLNPFYTVLIGVGLIQFIIGGIIEPRLYGNALNISPFVVIVSLVLWGMLWGIVGMVLCIPIMVITIIICSHFKQTRPIAVVLTIDGSLKGR